MGLGSLVRSAVEAVRAGTESLGMQGTVTVYQWQSQDGLGAPVEGDPVEYEALVVEGQQQRLTPDGRTLQSKACVILFPASESEGPPVVDRRDRVVLPSGLSSPILDIENCIIDPSTGQPHMRVLWL